MNKVSSSAAMIAPIIPADQWPEWADRHCWDERGVGQFIGFQTDKYSWRKWAANSGIPRPSGWDWRVPVMRPVALGSSVPAKPVAVIPTGHPTSVVQWLGPMPPQGTYLYAAPQPAPAIDLEQFWKLSDLWLAQAERVRALAPDKSTGLWAAAKELRDLLALIDRQAGVHSDAVVWVNRCNRTVPEALRYLANHPRPDGGEQRFNAAHLFQLADEIEHMASAPLYTVPMQPSNGEGE